MNWASIYLSIDRILLICHERLFAVLKLQNNARRREIASTEPYFLTNGKVHKWYLKLEVRHNRCSVHESTCAQQ